jgi:anti-repressor protein
MKVIANELIPVYENDKSERIVSARDLYSWVQSKQQFADWIKDRIEKYGFEEGNEFFITLGKTTDNGGRPKKEYYLRLDTAKEIAMLENNEQGKRVRRYFIDVERRAREMFAIPKTLPEALRLAADLAEKIEQDKPKVLFAETCLKSNESILIRELAKIIGGMGEHRLYSALRNQGLLMSNNEPYQEYIDRGYFEVIERPVVTSAGVILRRTTKVLPKGQTYIINKLAV